MRMILSLLICLAVFPAAQLGRAEEPPSPLRDFLVIGDTANQREDARVMAKCIAQKYTSTSQDVIRSDNIFLGYKFGRNILLDNTCLPRRLIRSSSFNSTNLYYDYIAENLLISDYKITNLPDISRVPPLDNHGVPDVDDSRWPVVYRRMFVINHWETRLKAVAECVARASPTEVFALAMTKPESEAELAQLGKLRSTLETCRVGELTPPPPQPFLRGFLGTALYRLVDAARPVTHP